jgi:DNA polymerase III epsilon subunit-like protein
MKHLMVDLETLGTVPGCVILSIGAVFFDENGLGDEFDKVISKRSCIDAGLLIDTNTEAWWAKQSVEATQVLRDAEIEGENTLLSVLTEFNAFIKRDTGVKVWGNGADFDNPILARAYQAAGIKQGWLPYNGRCYRTIKNIAANVPKLERVGTYHNALDDAKSQAIHLHAILQLNPELKLR